VKAFFLDRSEILSALKEAAGEARKAYPEIIEIRLIGSVARGDHSGLSDIDLFILADSPERNPIERMRPYFEFFTDRLSLPVDVIVAAPGEEDQFVEILKDSHSLVTTQR
jgi:predicted nucleotidyltransferase